MKKIVNHYKTEEKEKSKSKFWKRMQRMKTYKKLRKLGLDKSEINGLIPGSELQSAIKLKNTPVDETIDYIL